jgi:GT2 family glycosyltransferase
MKLSVIIVNYNVKHFLQQCLNSVLEAAKKIDTEIWVVDNNSVDGSVQMLKTNFPQIKLIANKTNLGFSKANNQAIKKAKGKYILLLNPDTIVEENTFVKIVDFMEKHPKAGGLGVRMIDGNGKFLPESKRGIPTPKVALFKMLGLCRLFPKSKLFARYYLGHLDKNKTNEVEILSGAFMLIRKSVLDEIGLLDETFFMYGEDIDLSYRILKAGYKNYYFADTTIIHYKGESTKKGSLNYVFVFYNAMIIFAKKHFAKKNAAFFMFLIKMAIVLRASLSVIKRLVSKVSIFLSDAILIISGYYFIVPLWEKFHFGGTKVYPHFIWQILLIYTTIWLVSCYFAGSYDKPVKLRSVISGITTGTIIILVFYALINVKYRFSRALILIGAAYSILVMLIFRLILFWLRKYTNFQLASEQNKKIFIVGTKKEAQRVQNILKQISNKIEILGIIRPDSGEINDNYVANIDQIYEIIKIFRPDELIFCSKNIQAKEIINTMSQFSELNINIKIAPQDSLSIIGSNSINTVGDLYTTDLNSLTKPQNKRLKILLDVSLSIIFLISSPILIFFVDNPKGFFKNIFDVLKMKKNWVGISTQKSKLTKKAILTPADFVKNNIKLTPNIIRQLNISYAKNYNIRTDLLIIFKNIKKLGKQ